MKYDDNKQSFTKKNSEPDCIKPFKISCKRLTDLVLFVAQVLPITNKCSRLYAHCYDMQNDCCYIGDTCVSVTMVMLFT